MTCQSSSCKIGDAAGVTGLGQSEVTQNSAQAVTPQSFSCGYSALSSMIDTAQLRLDNAAACVAAALAVPQGSAASRKYREGQGDGLLCVCGLCFTILLSMTSLPCRCGLTHPLEDEDVVQIVKQKVTTGGEEGKGRFKSTSTKGPQRIADREKKAALKT